MCSIRIYDVCLKYFEDCDDDQRLAFFSCIKKGSNKKNLSEVQCKSAQKASRNGSFKASGCCAGTHSNIKWRMLLKDSQMLPSYTALMDTERGGNVTHGRGAGGSDGPTQILSRTYTILCSQYF